MKLVLSKFVFINLSLHSLCHSSESRRCALACRYSEHLNKMEMFDTYLRELKKHSLSDITEHSHRPVLQGLLESIAKDKNKKIKILHEPKRHAELGSPDFKISINESIIGYIENKKIDEDLDKVLKSDQLKKYKELSDNILLTNYIEWIWIRKGEVLQRENLCYKTDIESKKFKLDNTRAEAVKNVIKNFISQPPIGLSKAKELASALAVRGRWLRDFLRIELHRQEKEHQEGKLFGLFNIFRTNIHAELTLDEFADAFSQTLIYGLFLAKLNAENETVNLDNAKRLISVSFELIKELVDFLDELDKEEYKEVKWIVEEVLSIMNNLNLGGLQESLSYKNWHRTLSKDMKDIVLKDPYVYFYEDFLAAYDKKMRKAKGVYYTPPPVVNFIVRAIDDILIDKFGIKDGFADRQKVTVLDFASGTGTFLLEIFENIFEKLPQKSGKRELIVKEHLLKNLYGFEFLIAPYTIAHLKLSQFLADNGHKLQGHERLQVYLTNTLEPLVPQQNAFVPALYEEGMKAKDVKEQPILVITGNPPYSGHSQNPSWQEITETKDGKTMTRKIPTWIGMQIENYKKVDGKPLGERNPKWLQDDYVKFIRFAQYKMEQVDKGIVGIITNHSFLDNPTFRGMRQSLMNTFDEMYFLDLHGNAKKKEKTPEGNKDENVFDIQQGVCISLLIKKKRLSKNIYHSNFYGLREVKYNNCLSRTKKDIEWKVVKPIMPFYLFIPQNTKLKVRYDKYFSILNIFKKQSLGIFTHRDFFLTDLNKNEIEKRIKIFKECNTESEAIKIFSIANTRDWSITKALKDIKKEEIQIFEYDYRPFDKRYICYNQCMFDRGTSRYELMKGFIDDNNIALNTSRNIQRQSSFSDILISNKLTDAHFCTGGNYTFPLYIYSNSEDSLFEGGIQKEVNYKKEFIDYFDSKYNKKYVPEEIIGYIYAVLHSPTYRNKYTEFLKIDFPRIPFTDDKKTFEKLSSLGWELTQVHLMKDLDSHLHGNDSIGVYSGEGNNEVVKVEYVKNKKTNLFRIKINPNQYFENVPEQIFNFHIGGYQVLDKYLKGRKGRELTLDEIENVEKIVKIIRFTIEQMKKIDKETKDWI